MVLRFNCMWILFCLLVVYIRRSVAYLKANKSKDITQANGCSCQYSGKMFNIEPLGKKDGSSRFTVRAKKYKGYMYAYNPCISFKIGPSKPSLNGKGCQNDVAVCWWLPQHLDSFTNIGTQSSFTCGLDDDGYPQLEYISLVQKSRKSTVRLRCDPSKKDVDGGFFEVLDEDNWVFRLTHNCACADACPESPGKVSPSTAKDAGVVVPSVIAAAIGVILVVPIFLLFRRWNRRHQEAEVRRRLLDIPGRVAQPNDNDCQGDLPHPIPETTIGRNSSNSAPINFSFDDITVPPKDNFNSIYGNKNLLRKSV